MSFSNVLLANADHSLLTIIPNKQLLNQSLQLVAPNKQFGSWSKQDHAQSYQLT